MTFFLGIDPGQTGGLALIRGTHLVWLEACPATIKGRYNALTNVTHTAATGLWGARRPQDDVAVMCAIEHVHTMPKQGIVSAGKFMMNYGVWLMGLAAVGIPYQQITPQKWMKHFGAMPKEKKARKHHLLHLAQQRFPDATIKLPLADAVMLAVYAQEVMTPQEKERECPTVTPSPKT